MKKRRAAKTIEAARNMTTQEVRGVRDSAAKHLLSDRQLLARLVKECVPEAAGYSLQQLETECIPKDIIVSKVPVTREDEEALGEQIRIEPDGATRTDDAPVRLENTEDAANLEGTVYFDILFTLQLPGKELALLIINVEIQNRSDTPYSLEARAVTYACRLVGRQGTDYGNIKKVYSIWIVANPDEDARNTTERIELGRQTGSGAVEPLPEELPQFEIVFLNLGDYQNAEQSDVPNIVRLLDVLFSTELTAEQKMSIVSENFGIQLADDTTTDIEEMDNMELALETRARSEGRAEGEATGIIKISRKFGLSNEQILEHLREELLLSPEQALDTLQAYDKNER